MAITILKGNIVFTSKKESFDIFEKSYLVIKDGLVEGVFPTLPEKYAGLPVRDCGDKLITPGLVDVHLHAPQTPNNGLGLDMELLPWLETYTFPEESTYKDAEYARKVYSKFVYNLWSLGTTRSVVFGTIHRRSTSLLMSLFEEAGLGAYVGKVNMDRNSPDFLCEKTDESLAETRLWLEEHPSKDALVRPIVTPRFVPSCTPKLMEGLGKMAAEFGVPVQSHLSENRSEVEWVKALHPEAKDYGDVYDRFGLFGQQKTVMAHCIYVTDREIQLMRDNQVYVGHSPISNVDLSSGIAPIRRFLDEGVPVGLATDVSGGHSLSMWDVIKSAIEVSKLRFVYVDQSQALSTSEAFWLATKSGGSFFGKVGSFEPGYEADVLVLDDSRLSDLKPRTIEERLQRFIYLGDDRDIAARYVRGKEVVLSKQFCC